MSFVGSASSQHFFLAGPHNKKPYKNEDGITNTKSVRDPINIEIASPYTIKTDERSIIDSSISMNSDIFCLGKRQRILKGQLQLMSPQEKLERQRAMRRKRDNAYRARKRATGLIIDPNMEQFFSILSSNKNFQSITIKYDAVSLSQSFFPMFLLNKANTDDVTLYKPSFDIFIENIRTKIRNAIGIKLSKERIATHVTSVSCILYCSQDKGHRRSVQTENTRRLAGILEELKKYDCQSYMRINYSFKTRILSLKFRHAKHNTNTTMSLMNGN